MYSTIAAGILRKLAYLAPVCLLLSCSQNLYLQFHTTDQNIKTQIMAAAAEYTKKNDGKIQIILTENGDSPADPKLPVIHVGYRVSPFIPAKSEERATIPADWGNDIPWKTSAVFERWGHNDGSGWLAVPLFWNGWGVSAFLDDRALLESSGKTVRKRILWNELPGVLGQKTKLSWPGSSTAGRQAWFAAVVSSNGDLPAYHGLASGNKQFSDLAQSFQAYARTGSLEFLLKDTDHYGLTDFKNSQEPKRNQVYLESFQQYFADKNTDTRVMLPLLVTRNDGSAAMVAELLAAWLTGPGVQKLADGFLRQLLDPEFQKSFSLASGLMPANFQAPVLDEVNLAFRNQLLTCTDIALINPEPDSEPPIILIDKTLAAIRSSPLQWEVILPAK